MLSVVGFAQDDKKGTIKVKKVDTSRSEIVIPIGYESTIVKVPLTVVEQMPTFPGGEKAMFDFIQKNLKYPEAEKKAGVQGTVYITFLVGTDGTISEVVVLRGVAGGPGLNAEASRIVKMMPKWIAGKQNGRNVVVQYNLPIMFKLK